MSIENWIGKAGDIIASLIKRRANYHGSSPFDSPASSKTQKSNVVALASVHGIGLGVLSDGSPFFTKAGLTRLLDMVVEDLPVTYADLLGDSKAIHLVSDIAAYAPDILLTEEVSGLTPARLAEFVFVQAGYETRNDLSAIWRLFHERVALMQNYAPAGSFTVPKELSDLVVALSRQGVAMAGGIEDIFLADQLWWENWDAEWLADRFPPRLRYAMTYPTYIPHSTSAIQSPHCFPGQALEEFRKWFEISELSARLGINFSSLRQQDWQWPYSVCRLPGTVRNKLRCD